VNGFDVVLSRAVPESALKSELVRSLHVQADALELMDVGALGSKGSASKVICTATVVGGEFPLLLAIFAPDDFELPSPTAVAEHLSRTLDVSVLVDDGTSHPYRMTLIRWDAAPCIVEIHPSDDEQINLVRSSPRRAL